MDIEQVREYALSLSDVTEGFPFGETVLVFKTNDKIFLLLPLDTDGLQFNVKCDPEWAVELREEYPSAILPGYHMNKKHWNTIRVDGSLSGAQIRDMIRHSHELVGNKKKGVRKSK